MKYVYWHERDERPKTIPDGCEFRGFSRWEPETDAPSGWSFLTRRWPDKIVKAKVKAKAKREPGYVYWVEGQAKPDACPRGCEYLPWHGKSWRKEKDHPCNWMSLDRRWPKPVVKAKPVRKARPSVASVIARIRKHADAGIRDYGVLAMNYIKAELSAIEKG